MTCRPNGQCGIATWLYIDEFHTLLNSEYSAKYLQQFWKKVRKQGGLCTGITQNVMDLLQNYTATTMLANSEFVALMECQVPRHGHSLPDFFLKKFPDMQLTTAICNDKL